MMRRFPSHGSLSQQAPSKDTEGQGLSTNLKVPISTPVTRANQSSRFLVILPTKIRLMVYDLIIYHHTTKPLDAWKGLLLLCRKVNTELAPLFCRNVKFNLHTKQVIDNPWYDEARSIEYQAEFFQDRIPYDLFVDQIMTQPRPIAKAEPLDFANLFLSGLSEAKISNIKHTDYDASIAIESIIWRRSS
jgi:hypothetical protein